jgi:hypothetical protein
MDGTCPVIPKSNGKTLNANTQRISNYLQGQISPGLFGYFNVQSTELEARQAIAHSIDAFVVYLAYTSFLIALYRYYP